MSSAPQVAVTQGKLQGATLETTSGKVYHSFQGIPYAKPPIGSLRFKDPQPAEPWQGIRDATAEGNLCSQYSYNPLGKEHTFVGGEDCLYLNVYTPTLEEKELPVMFFSHSGVFQFGSGDTNSYGPDFLVEKDVILVTFNYRLGALGFLCLNTPQVPGNAGLKDQALALKWVRDNIKKFGGNPNNITVFGSGSGAASSSYLTLSPLTKNLISKAIFQSGTSINRWAYKQQDPVEAAKCLAKNLGVESNDVDEILSYLESAPVRDVIDAASKLYDLNDVFNNNVFEPVIEKEFSSVQAFLTESSFEILSSARAPEIPYLIGSNESEGLFMLSFPDFTVETDLRKFIPQTFHLDFNSKEAVDIANKLHEFYFDNKHIGMETIPEYINLLTDSIFTADIDRYVTLLKHSSNKSIYYYKFSYFGNGNVLKTLGNNFGIRKAAHLDELGYLFNTSYLKDVDFTSEDIKTRERIVRMWTNFAKFGNPVPEESHILTCTWLPINDEHRYYLNIGNELTLATNPDYERMELWQKLHEKYFKIWENVPSKSHVHIPSAHHASRLYTKMQIDEEHSLSKDQNEKCFEKEEDIIIQNIDKVLIEDEMKVGNGFGTYANGGPTSVIRANDPPEDDLPKNIGVNKFVNFFESLGGKK